MTDMEMNKLYTKINDMAVCLAEIKTKLEERDRPCPDLVHLRREFDGHILQQSDNAGDWRQAAIKGVVDILKIAVVAGFVAWWTLTTNGGA